MQILKCKPRYIERSEQCRKEMQISYNIYEIRTLLNGSGSGFFRRDIFRHFDVII